MGKEKKVYVWQDELGNLCNMVSTGLENWKIAKMYDIPEKQLGKIFIILGISKKRVNRKKFMDNKEGVGL